MLLTFLQDLSDRFWNTQVWLPPNVTWNDIAPRDDLPYTDHRHLAIPIPLACVMLIIRYFLEKYFFAPVGISFGIKLTKSKKAQPNHVLEKAYKSCSKKLKHKQLVILAKQSDFTERQVERWWRLRRSQDKPSALVKFCESAWRWFYYTLSFTFGFICLWNKPWLWDINQCYYEYPHQGITDDIWWYYMISMSFYWSLAVSQFYDVKRKDFWQMFIHHIATLLLLAFSWVCNLHRIGSLVLFLHDCADIFLEAAKLAKYANLQKLCDGIFIFFTLLWIVTRNGIYPFVILRSTLIEAPQIVPMFPAYYIFNSLLSLLLLLHLFWTYVILKIAYTSLIAGQMDGDLRSSSSEVSEDPVEEK